MKGLLRIVRDNEVKISLPAARVKIKEDGTIWFQGMPILGITDPELKAKIVADIKVKKYDRIPADAWVRLGENENGVWAGGDDAWETHPGKIATGYCFSCETWCHGDCGNYSKAPMIKFRRDLRHAQREANYGIEDGE